MDVMYDEQQKIAAVFGGRVRCSGKRIGTRDRECARCQEEENQEELAVYGDIS